MAAGLVTEAYPLDLLFQNSQIEDEPEVGAIYRGGPLFRPQVRSSSPHSLRSASTSSSSSSSSSSFFAGRLGAIAAVVELAISRWARGRTSSSSDSSSSSSQSSITTQSRSRVSRRRRRRSGSSHLHSIQSERDIRARIKAREESRQISREFTLYIPPGLVSAQPPPHGNEEAALSGVSRTTSLPSVLAKLEAALRRSTKARRAYDRSRNPKLLSVPLHDPMAHHHYMLPDSISWPDVTTSRKGRKGKERDNGAVTEPVTMAPSPSETAGAIVNHKAWWLDVARPTWADMSAIGKLLQLHPLTLEDILQQDPREKLELFPKLGYYFLVFRAIESQTTRARFLQQINQVTAQSHNGDQGIVGEALVYLVVFKEGICSFHYMDISEHTDRVRNRLLLLEEGNIMSSDWIAHGILDSVVDSFFPFLEEIEREIVGVEDYVYFKPCDRRLSPRDRAVTSQDTLRGDSIPNLGGALLKKGKTTTQTEEKAIVDGNIVTVAEHIPASPSGAELSLHRVLRRIWSRITQSKASVSSATTPTLHRMARTRRLVTSLVRLLATKSEVVAQIRKRPRNGNDNGDDAEVAMYMGDIQDHILTLQQALNHYEHVLSQLYPIYLAQLSTSLSKTKQRTDQALLKLTVVSIAVLSVQTIIGLLSMNITVPTNKHEPTGSFTIFGIVVALAFLDICALLLLVRRWWMQAKKKSTVAH